MKKPSTESYGLPDNAIDELDEKLDTALSEIEELKKDKARLDSLQQALTRARALKLGGVIGVRVETSESIRAAIDLGMEGDWVTVKEFEV